MTDSIARDKFSDIFFREIGNSFQTISIIGGSLIIILAFFMFALGQDPKLLLSSAKETLGTPFLALTFSLTAISILSISKIIDGNPSQREKNIWLLLGFHSSNGIATLALTFTLFGISKGIGGLTAETLNIDQINAVITTLTSQFSMAFLTSVIGLPLSAVLRVTVAVAGKKQGL